MANGKAFLDCPLCGEPVATIPACNDAHKECAGVPPRATHPVWCEDREGACEHCGAVLSVNVDWEDGATLVATGEDDDDGKR